MSILVTGANGWVGQSLCRQLRHRGFTVRAAVRRGASALATFECIEVGAIDGETNWQTALAGIKTVVHLAARVHVMKDTAADPLGEFRRVNVQGSGNLAQQAAAAGVQRLVFVSSVKVHGELTQTGQAFAETDLPTPLDNYGLSKWEAEQGLQHIARETGLEVVIIRPPLVYGPGVKANFAALMHWVQRGRPLPFGAINNARSLVALDNLVDLIITCIDHPLAANQTFLVSDGHDLSTADLVRGIALAAGVSPHLWPIPVWCLQLLAALLGKSDSMARLCGNLQVDISKAREVLGWSPILSVTEGLRKAVQDK